MAVVWLQRESGRVTTQETIWQYAFLRWYAFGPIVPCLDPFE